MLIKTIKYFVAFISFLLGCMDIYYNNALKSNMIESMEYVNNSYKEITYEAYLRIPKINLSQPLYSKEDKRSDIDQNIIFVEDSDMPTTENGNVIIAGHSGSSTVSYFKYLHKLEIGDVIYLEYDDEVYKFRVDNRYFVKKTGVVEVIRDTNTKSLTLVTCYGNTKQLVIVANIVSQTKK